MKAVLKVESSTDTAKVMKILMINNVTILKTYEPFIDPGLRITIEVVDQNELNRLILELNQGTYFSVIPVKIYSESWIDRLFKRGKRHESKVDN